MCEKTGKNNDDQGHIRQGPSVIASSDNQEKQNILDPFIELVDIIDDKIVNKLQKIALETRNIVFELPESQGIPLAN